MDYKKWIVPAFFLLFLLIGLWIVPDYGISWDEPNQRRHGRVTVDYLNDYFGLGNEKLEPEYELKNYYWRHYGMLFQVVAHNVEQWVGAESYRSKHLVRHYLVFLVFWLGCIGFYLLLRKRFLRWEWALLGTLFLVLSPRIFAHSFYNVKDLVFMSAFIWGMLSMWKFVENPKLKTALLHAFVTAIIIDIRIVGILLPGITFGWLLVYGILHRQTGRKPLHLAGYFLLYLLLCWPLIVAFWPYLWKAPYLNFYEAYEAMGHYDWQGQVLLWNEWLTPYKDTPWHYTLSWMLLTTPLAYTLLFLVGLVRSLGKVFASLPRWRFTWFTDKNWRFDLVGMSCYLLPLLIVMIKGSTLYDGWRQMFFIYPGFLIIALSGLSYLHQQRAFRRWLLPATGVALLLVLGKMIWLHPFQQTYFNPLAGNDRELRFDQDYWGLSYKQGLEELVRRDTSEKITYYAANFPGAANREFLKKEVRQHLDQLWGDRPDADYYITNFRGPWELKRYKKGDPPLENPFIIIKSGNTPILGVYKLKD